MQDARSTARQSVGLTGLLALATAFYFGFFQRKKRKDSSVGKWLLLAGILADLFWFGWKYYATLPIRELQPPQEIVEFMSREKEPFRLMAPYLAPNAFMLSRTESMGGYAGNILERYNRFLNRAQGMGEENLQSLTQITQYALAFHLLNIKYLVLPSKVRVDTPHFRRLFSAGDLTVYQNQSFIPRIYFPQRVRFVESSQEALALAAGGGYDPRELSILEDRSRQGEKIDYGEVQARFKLLKYTPNEIHLEVQSSATALSGNCQLFRPQLEGIHR